MSGRGGYREGGGRKPGTPNKNTQHIRDILDKVVDFKVVAEKLFQLVQGVQVQQVTFDGVVTYKEKPDVFAAKVLLEYRYGKPFQSIAIANMNNEHPSIAIIQQGEEISLHVKEPEEEGNEEITPHTEIKAIGDEGLTGPDKT